MEELVKDINLKKVGTISFIVALSVFSYYVLSTYKTYLEIVELQKNQE